MKLPLAITLAAAVCLPAGYFAGRAGRTESGETPSAPRIPAVVKRPPPEAIHAAATLSDATATLAELTNEQVKERTMKALREPDRILRWKAWMDILAGMNEDNAAAISESLMERYNAGGNTGEEGEILQFREGQILGIRSMKNLPAEPNGKVDWPQMNAMRGWASMDPAAAKEWLDRLEPGAVQSTLRAKWLEGLAKSTPDRIAAAFPSLTAHQQRPLLHGLINGIYDEGGLKGIRSWFDKRGHSLEPAVAEVALANITNRVANDSSRWDEAAEMLKEKAGEACFSPGVFEAYNFQVASKDPGKCLDLLSTLAGKSAAIERSLDSSIARTVELSTTTSLNTLGTWLDSHRNHPLYDRTVRHFALRTRQDDPEAALRWAETIKDEALREQTRAALQARQ